MSVVDRTIVGGLVPGEVALLAEDCREGGSMYGRTMLAGTKVKCLWHVHSYTGNGAKKKRGAPEVTFVDAYDDWTFFWPNEPKAIPSQTKLAGILVTRYAGAETHAHGDALDPMRRQGR